MRSRQRAATAPTDKRRLSTLPAAAAAAAAALSARRRQATRLAALLYVLLLHVTVFVVLAARVEALPLAGAPADAAVQRLRVPE